MMQIINKLCLAITSIVVAAPLLTAAVQKPYIADYSNRCSLTDVMSLGSFNTDTRKVLAEVPFNTADFATLHLKALIPATADYLLGVEGQDAKVKSCPLAK